jgi:hypothetical protein
VNTFLVDHPTLHLIERCGSRTEIVGIAERVDDRLVRIDLDGVSDWTSSAGRLYCGALLAAAAYACDSIAATILQARCSLESLPTIGIPEVKGGDRLFVYLEPGVFEVLDVH